MSSIIIGDYFIKTFDHVAPPEKRSNMWIQHEDGEGMEVTVEKFEECMKQFFKENM